jgi:magnesium-transporting ATPase (P-type)
LCLLQDIKVGDFVYVVDGQEVPADMVLLASSEMFGSAYIETSNIDGEANLKVKNSAPSGTHFTDFVRACEPLDELYAPLICFPESRSRRDACMEYCGGTAQNFSASRLRASKQQHTFFFRFAEICRDVLWESRPAVSDPRLHQLHWGRS